MTDAAQADRASIEACRTPCAPAALVTVTASWLSTPRSVSAPAAVTEVKGPRTNAANAIG